MTEEQWLAATDPYGMLEHLKGMISERKLLLFTAACVRRNLMFPCEPEQRRVALAGEQFLSGAISPETFHDTVAASYGPEYPAKLFRSRAYNAHEQSRFVSEMFRFHAAHGRYSPDDPPHADCYAVRDRERQRHREILRELIGNPFRPATVDPAWLTSAVVPLAEGIYADCSFDRLPILGDALEEAGCDNADILAHCRTPGPHVRGCWVVDLILGKS